MGKARAKAKSPAETDPTPYLVPGLGEVPAADPLRPLPPTLQALFLTRLLDEAARGKVTLSTLHSAKGLEWPLVFLIGCEEGTMPHKRVSAPRISDAIAGDIEEERRLFYVGITRARDRLFITRAATRLERGAQVPRKPSRFLDDLPEAEIRVHDIARDERLGHDNIASMAEAFLANLAKGL